MDINFYIGKLGYEHRIYTIKSEDHADYFPLHRKDLVTLPVDADGNKLVDEDNDVYVVQQVMNDYTYKNIEVFLKPYDWEE